MDCVVGEMDDGPFKWQGRGPIGREDEIELEVACWAESGGKSAGPVGVCGIWVGAGRWAAPELADCGPADSEFRMGLGEGFWAALGLRAGPELKFELNS